MAGNPCPYAFTRYLPVCRPAIRTYFRLPAALVRQPGLDYDILFGDIEGRAVPTKPRCKSG